MGLCTCSKRIKTIPEIDLKLEQCHVGQCEKVVAASGDMYRTSVHTPLIKMCAKHLQVFFKVLIVNFNT